jgi:hypothetical protein
MQVNKSGKSYHSTQSSNKTKQNKHMTQETKTLLGIQRHPINNNHRRYHRLRRYESNVPVIGIVALYAFGVLTGILLNMIINL